MLKKQKKLARVSKPAIFISIMLVICTLIFCFLTLSSIPKISISNVISQDILNLANNYSSNLYDKSKNDNDKIITKNDQQNTKQNNINNNSFDANDPSFNSIYKYADPRLVSNNLLSPLYDKQFPFIPADLDKANSVKEAFLHGYNSYKKYCWKSDELKPISKKCKNTLNAGLTIVDSITTLYIMNLTEEYLEAREFIEKEFKPNGQWSLFEFIIRFVGAFISIYQLSNDKLFLNKAVQCADAIYPLFDKENGFYTSKFTLTTDENGTMTAKQASMHISKRDINLAEVGTYQIEFLTLTALTGDKKYMELALKVYKRLWKDNPHKAILYSALENQLEKNHKIRSSQIRHLGAGADSYFEYIIKSYILTNGVSPRILEQHMKIIQEMRDTLLFETKKLHLNGIGVLKGDSLSPYMEHLATFVPGMIAIGTVKNNNNKDDDLSLAKKMVDTIWFVMNSTLAKLMPEKVFFNINNDSYIDKEFNIVLNEYFLRPESVESIFYLYRFTGEQKYRDIAWDFFIGINESCRVKDGFASVKGLNGKIKYVDIMDSWFLAETLNYLYLTFADTRLISPAEWVFNTESHPLHVWPKNISGKYKKSLLL